jgi:hypothetical protein
VRLEGRGFRPPPAPQSGPSGRGFGFFRGRVPENLFGLLSGPLRGSQRIGFSGRGRARLVRVRGAGAPIPNNCTLVTTRLQPGAGLPGTPPPPAPPAPPAPSRLAYPEQLFGLPRPVAPAGSCPVAHNFFYFLC